MKKLEIILKEVSDLLQNPPKHWDLNDPLVFYAAEIKGTTLSFSTSPSTHDVEINFKNGELSQILYHNESGEFKKIIFE